ERVKKILPADWAARLTQPQLPFGYTSAQWGAFISSQLILGDIPYAPISGHLLSYLLRALDRYQELKDNEQLHLLTPQETASLNYINSQMTSYSSGSLFRAIACNELWGDWREGRTLNSGRLEATGPNICRTRNLPGVPFDSKNWLTRSRVYYFQG